MSNLIVVIDPPAVGKMDVGQAPGRPEGHVLLGHDENTDFERDSVYARARTVTLVGARRKR